MLCSARRIDAVFKFCPEEKMNQRLFKRLILYYNVGNATEAPRGRIFTKADSAPSDFLMTVGGLFTGQPGSAPPNGAKPSAAFPFGVGDRAFGP
jgi:hypothetical protein